jgi:cell division protein FtsA
VAGEIVVGLDIGTTKVCTVVAEVTPNGGANVIGYSYVPCAGLRKGLVIDMDATVAAIKESVRQASEASSVNIQSVTIGVTGQHVNSFNSRGSMAFGNAGHEITEEDRLLVLERAKEVPCPPDQQMLHVIPRQYIVDGLGGIQKPVGMTGSRLEVECHVVTASRSFVDNVVRCVRRAGLELDDSDDNVVLEAIATAEAVLTEEERQLGVALADIGGGTTDIAVFKDGTIFHSSVISVGGENVTNDIAIGLKLPPSEAARVKLEYGLAAVHMAGEDEFIEVTQIGSSKPTVLPRRVLCEVIEPRIREIFRRGVLAKLDECGASSLLPAGVVVTGGASLLPGLVDLAAQELEMPVRLGLPRCQGGLSDVLSGPQFSTAVGLAKIAAKRYAVGELDAEDGGLFDSFGRLVAGFLSRLFGRKHRRSVRRNRPR